MAAPVSIPAAHLIQGFLKAYYAEATANPALNPEAIYSQLAKLFGSKNPLLLVRQGVELRTKEDIVAKFQRIQQLGLSVELSGCNGDYLSLSGHPAGEPSPFHLVTWGIMRIGSQAPVPFTESFVLAGSRSGSSYAYSINRAVLLFPTLTTDIDDHNSEHSAPVVADATPAGSIVVGNKGSPLDTSPSSDWEIVPSSSVPTAVPPPASDASVAPPSSNRSREPKARTPRKTQEASESPTAAAVGATPASAADVAVKEKQDKHSAPTSYASALAARMVPASKEEPRRQQAPVQPPTTGGVAAASSISSASHPAHRAPAAGREAAEELPNGIIVKRIPEGVRFNMEFVQALFPGKKIASVQHVADKSHGFVYMQHEDDLRTLAVPTPVTFSFQGNTVTVSIDRKKAKGEVPRGRSQPHTDGFTEVSGRSRGKSDARAEGEEGARGVHGSQNGRPTRGGGRAKPHAH